jgi:hypothetical protein
VRFRPGLGSANGCTMILFVVLGCKTLSKYFSVFGGHVVEHNLLSTKRQEFQKVKCLYLSLVFSSYPMIPVTYDGKIILKIF